MIALFLSLAFVIVGGITAPLWWGIVTRWVSAPWQNRAPSARLFRLIIGLLDQDGWRRDRFYLRHESGVSLWIANKDYGLGIALKGDAHPGGDASDEIPINAYWRHKLWQAVQRHIADESAASLERDLEAFAGKVIDFVKERERRA